MSEYQVGVIPITKEGKLVLVTTQNGDYWIFLKGNLEKGRSDRAVARSEAFEEAGLEGVMKRQYRDIKTPLGKVKRLRVYAMKVKNIRNNFPEKKKRKRVIVTFQEADKLLEKDLRSALKKLNYCLFGLMLTLHVHLIAMQC